MIIYPSCRHSTIRETPWGDTVYCVCQDCGQRFERERRPTIRIGSEAWKLRRELGGVR